MKTAIRERQINTTDTRHEDVHLHHEELVAGIKEEMRYILQNSVQPVLIYLDDNHKTSNLAMAHMFGYGSVEEFEKADVNFVETYIAEESQQAVMENYRVDFKQQLKATVVDVVIRNLAGDKRKVQLIHTPVMYRGHLFAVSFVNE